MITDSRPTKAKWQGGSKAIYTMKIQKAQEWVGPVPCENEGKSKVQTGRLVESLRKVRLSDPLSSST